MSKSGVGWTDNSLNPYGWHCNPVSPGCQNCYAMAWAEQKGHKFKTPPEWKGDDWFYRELRKIKDGERVFVNSFSDTFHQRANPIWIHKIFSAAVQRPGVIFQVLTKRPERAHRMADDLPWPDNLWIGTSVESSDYVGRINLLQRIPTPNRFISFEPLLGPIGQVDLAGIGWVITGGESGPKRRPFDRRWAMEIIEQARALDIPVYHKQGSAYSPGQDRPIDGMIFDQFPTAFDVPSEVTEVPQQLELF